MIMLILFFKSLNKFTTLILMKIAYKMSELQKQDDEKIDLIPTKIYRAVPLVVALIAGVVAARRVRV